MGLNLKRNAQPLGERCWRTSKASVPSPEPAEVLLFPDFWESLLNPAASRHCPAARAMILEAAEDTFLSIEAFSGVCGDGGVDTVT